MTAIPRAPLTVVAFCGRCPRCGQGALFDGYLAIRPACEACGLSLAGHDTADGPAFFVMMPLSILTMILILLVEVMGRPPLWVHLVVWPVFIALIAALGLRPIKATLVALQYRFRDVEREIEGVD